MAGQSFSDPVCLLREAKGGLELAPDGATLLESLAEPGAVISIANIRGLQHKALLHALGLLSFPHEPGLYAWTLDRSPAAPVLMLIVWESHNNVLLELLILLGTVVLFATEEFLDLEPLLPLATFASRLRIDGVTGDSQNAGIGKEMPQLMWLLSAWGAGQRIVSPDDGLADDDGGGGMGRGGDAEQQGGQIRSLADLLEWRLRPELALGFTDDAARAAKAAEAEQERAKAKAQAHEDALAAAAAATAAAAAEAEEAAPAASFFGIGGALKMMHSALADGADTPQSNGEGGNPSSGAHPGRRDGSDSDMQDGDGDRDRDADTNANGHGKDDGSDDGLGMGIGNALSSFHDALRPMRARPTAKDPNAVAQGPNAAHNEKAASAAAGGQMGRDPQQHGSANSTGDEGEGQRAQHQGGWLEHQAKLRAQELLRSSGDTSVTDAFNGPSSGSACGDTLSPRQRNDARRAIRAIFPSGRRHCAALVRATLSSDDQVVPASWRESSSSCICTAPEALFGKVLDIALDAGGEMREGKCLLGFCLGGPVLLAIAKVWLQFSKAAEAGTDRSDSPGHVDLTTMLEQAAVVMCAGAARSARESYRKQLQMELQRTSGDAQADTADTEQLYSVHPSLRATALAQFDTLSAPCLDFGASARAKHRLDLAAGLDEDMRGASSALDAVFVEQLAKRLHVQVNDDVLQRVKPQRRAAVNSPSATSSPVARQNGIESIDALRESLQQTLRSFCQSSTTGTVPLWRPQSNGGHSRALTLHEQAVLHFCLATGSGNTSDVATTTVDTVPSTERVDNLSVASIFDDFANAQLRRVTRAAVRSALREQKKRLRAAYAERDANIKAELAAQRKAFESATAVAKQQQKQASAELVAVRNALAGGRRRVVEAQRLVGLAVVDESEASATLEAARADLRAVEAETQEIDRRCAALVQEASSARDDLAAGRARAAQHRVESQVAVSDALASGDAQVKAHEKLLQREREEHEALRARLAAFHETLAMLPPELQQSFFDAADEGNGSGIGRRGSAFASALGSFIDAAVDAGGEESSDVGIAR